MRLLLAVDLADHAEELVAQGVAWARKLGALLDLVFVDEHAYDVYVLQDPAIRTVLDREWTKIRETQTSRLQHLLAQIPLEHRGEAVLRAGRAPDEVVELGKARDAILVSTHGRRGLSHALLGSVAERIVRTSTVPVLVLRLASTAA